MSSENDYRIEGYNSNYLSASEKINTNDPNSKILTKDLVLHPLGVYTLIGNIKDANTKKEISDVLVSIKDKVLNKEIFNQLTDSVGSFEKVLGKLNEGDNINYEIILEKKGYNNKIIQYTTTLGKQNIIELNELLDLNLTPSNKANNFDSNESNISIPVIYFDLDEYTIREDAKRELDNFVLLLKQRSDIKIEISGHTDCRATNAYNMYLSQQRAKATAQYLLNKGISKNRITLKWYGENNLATNCPCENTDESSCSEDQHQQNRRSNFKITSYKIDSSKKEGL